MVLVSSFAFFRKYTGLMMVVLCALLMFAFVVADPLMQSMGSGGQRDSRSGDVAVSWDGGELTEGELANLVARRQVLSAFHNQVLQLGYQSALLEGAVNPQPLVQPLSLPSSMEQRVEQDVVITKMYADAARKAGIVVSDDAIRDYLDELGFRKVSRDQMRDILASMPGPRGGMTIDFVFDLLRDALLARNFDRSFFYTSATVMPQQKWSDWLQVNDRVIVEAAALRAGDFLNQVEEPSDEELKAFYEEYKDDVPAPQQVGGVQLPSPDPAFSTPRRVVLEYAKLELSKEIDRLIDTVTDEEITEFYEQNKDRYVKDDSMDEDFLNRDVGLAPDEDPENGEESTEETSEESGEGAAMEQSTEAVAESSEAEEPEADASETDAEETANEPAGEEEATSEESAEEPAEDESSSLRPRSPFRLAAYQPAAEADTEAEVDDEAAAEEGDEEGDEEPAAEETPAEISEESEMSADEALFGTDSPEVSEDESADEGDGEEADKPVEYKPLEEVRDDVRQAVAERKAISGLRARMEEIVAPLQDAYDKYLIEMIDAKERAKKNPDAELPEPPAVLKQLATLAEEQGLEYAKTADLSILELSKSSIGTTRDLTRSMRGPTPNTPVPMVLWGRLLGDSGIEMHEPLLTYDVTFDRMGNAYPLNGYVVLKVHDEPLKTPALDEIRADVVRAWKLREASKLALKRAEEIAKEAQGEGLSLRDFLASEPSIRVEETDAFSRLTAGQISPATQRIPLRLSQPEPIESPGPDFMEEVFGLGPNEIGAALNHDQSVAYVVRVVQHMSSRSELRSDFLSIGQLYYNLYGFNQVHVENAKSAITRELLGAPEGESPLDWKREPDTPFTGDEESES